MVVIGITGTSGSGKSSVCKILKEKYNAQIIDADKIARQLSLNGSKYFEKIVKTFGEKILDSDKQINRKKLADIIYKSEDDKKKLDDLTNIYVVKEIENKIKECKKKIIALDVPLLIESNLNRKCDIVIGIIAKEKIKLERICCRDLVEEKIAKQRLNIQPSDDFYKKNSDYIIQNDDSNLEKKIEKIINQIEEKNKNV